MSAETTVPQTQECAVPVRQEQSRDEERFVTPPVDIYELTDKLVVVADVPGVDKDTVSVHVENGILTIEAKAAATNDVAPVYREYQLANFYRQFQISERIDTENIVAEYKNGVLQVELPKVAKAQPKQIEVKVSA